MWHPYYSIATKGCIADITQHINYISHIYIQILMANSVTMNNSWEHTELEWDAFLESISGSEKKTLWRDKKKEK